LLSFLQLDLVLFCLDVCVVANDVTESPVSQFNYLLEGEWVWVLGTEVGRWFLVLVVCEEKPEIICLLL
jgi:hypothetical protein